MGTLQFLQVIMSRESTGARWTWRWWTPAKLWPEPARA